MVDKPKCAKHGVEMELAIRDAGEWLWRCPDCFAEGLAAELAMSAAPGKPMASLHSAVVAVSLIPAGMLWLAIVGRWPYGFFILLRWVVTGCAAYLATAAHKQQSQGWMWTMVAIGVLFNPLVPIYLRRDTWQVIDFVTAPVFVGAGIALRRNS